MTGKHSGAEFCGTGDIASFYFRDISTYHGFALKNFFQETIGIPPVKAFLFCAQSKINFLRFYSIDHCILRRPSPRFLKRITYADLNERDAECSGFNDCPAIRIETQPIKTYIDMHFCDFRFVFLACKENEPEITKVHINVSFNRLRFYSYGWTIVKTTTFGVPLVQVGIRDSFQKSWRRPPQYAVIDAIKTEKVYLALSAKQEGLDGWYANCLLKKIFQCKTVIGADITEIKRCDIPRAAKLCATMLAGHAARRA